MYPVELLLLFMNGLNPTITAAFISTFNSFIAVGGSLLGAITGSAITLYFTGRNQRKHFKLETELKKKKEFEEQKKLLMLELMELWKEAFWQASDYFSLVLNIALQTKFQSMKQPSRFHLKVLR